jgi:hypothetical protein
LPDDVAKPAADPIAIDCASNLLADVESQPEFVAGVGQRSYSEEASVLTPTLTKNSLKGSVAAQRLVKGHRSIVKATTVRRPAAAGREHAAPG